MTPAERIIALLKEYGLTLSLAESCTGGLIAKELTDIPGASEVFPGSVVSYSDRVKQDVLGVDPEIIAMDTAVSASCAEAMAKGVLQLLHTDLALSVTGYAGPYDELTGLVYLSVAVGEGALTRELHLRGNRSQIRAEAANEAKLLLLSVLDQLKGQTDLISLLF